jgi:hypothetical protein
MIQHRGYKKGQQGHHTDHGDDQETRSSIMTSVSSTVVSCLMTSERRECFGVSLWNSNEISSSCITSWRKEIETRREEEGKDEKEQKLIQRGELKDSTDKKDEGNMSMDIRPPREHLEDRALESLVEHDSALSENSEDSLGNTVRQWDYSRRNTELSTRTHTSFLVSRERACFSVFWTSDWSDLSVLRNGLHKRY